MTRPWEETWRVDDVPGDEHYVLGKLGKNDVVAFCEMRDHESVDPDFGYDHRARSARLIAAAPEMARMLLELSHGVDTSDGEYSDRCPVCQDRTRLPPDGKVGIPLDIHPGKHAPDCRLVDVLRKAGALPPEPDDNNG